jgi:hypothetical protein
MPLPVSLRYVRAASPYRGAALCCCVTICCSVARRKTLSRYDAALNRHQPPTLLLSFLAVSLRCLSPHYSAVFPVCLPHFVASCAKLCRYTTWCVVSLQCTSTLHRQILFRVAVLPWYGAVRCCCFGSLCITRGISLVLRYVAVCLRYHSVSRCSVPSIYAILRCTI